jgi:hypothetical protein
MVADGVVPPADGPARRNAPSLAAILWTVGNLALRRPVVDHRYLVTHTRGWL